MFKEIKDKKNGGNMTFKKFSEIKKKYNILYSELLAINSQDRFHKLLSHDDTHPILFIQAISIKKKLNRHLVMFLKKCITHIFLAI